MSIRTNPARSGGVLWLNLLRWFVTAPPRGPDAPSVVRVGSVA